MDTSDIFSSCTHLFFFFFFILFTCSDNTYVDLYGTLKFINSVCLVHLSLHLFSSLQCSLSLSKKPFSFSCQENPSKVCLHFYFHFALHFGLEFVNLIYFLLVLFDLLYFHPVARSQILKMGMCV